MPEKKYIRFIDEYHTDIGGHHYHICEFAERMEQIGAKYEPLDYIREPEFYARHFLPPMKTAPAPLTVLSTQGRSTVLRLRPRGLRGARSIAFSDSGWMKAASLMLAASFSGAII